MTTFTLFKRQDWLLNTAIFALISASLVMMRSIRTELFMQQLGWSVIAILVIFIFAHIDWRALSAYKWIIAGIYFFSIALLIATYFFAPTIRNTRAWLVIGPAQFQVSEFVKVALIIFFAYFFSKRHVGIARISTIIRPFVYFFIPATFIFLQPDMGTVIVLFCIWVGFLLISGLPIKYIVIGFLVVAVVITASWFTVLKPYQKERIVGLFDPNYDPLGVNYSTIQSKIAVGSAGWLGKGFGQGTQVQLGFLPEAGTDYIFASFTEEWGFLGAMFIIGIFCLAIFSIMRIGLYAEGNFYRFIALGAAIMFMVQFGINVGSALGLLPVIGITFPFFSYGGSSLLINAMLVGIVQSAAVYRSLS
jgi:rod shape determining protein RodA